jgi:hypothetical protein
MPLALFILGFCCCRKRAWRESLSTPDLTRDPDGGLTIYLQHESPGKDKESNWLPAPKGPFVAFLRVYWPMEAALNGMWKPLAVQRVK